MHDIIPMASLVIGLARTGRDSHETPPGLYAAKDLTTTGPVRIWLFPIVKVFYLPLGLFRYLGNDRGYKVIG